jgi:hypothetical protein
MADGSFGVFYSAMDMTGINSNEYNGHRIDIDKYDATNKTPYLK